MCLFRRAWQSCAAMTQLRLVEWQVMCGGCHFSYWGKMKDKIFMFGSFNYIVTCSLFRSLCSVSTSFIQQCNGDKASLPHQSYSYPVDAVCLEPKARSRQKQGWIHSSSLNPSIIPAPALPDPNNPTAFFQQIIFRCRIWTALFKWRMHKHYAI